MIKDVFSSFVAAFLMIVASEVGDKTFLITAIMAMRNSRRVVFSAALFALVLMTIISAGFGIILPTIIPKGLAIILSSILFVAFGVKMIKESMEMGEATLQEEYEEVAHEIEMRRAGGSKLNAEEPDLEACNSASAETGSFHFCSQIYQRATSAVAGQVFVLTFIAEWGDRSQIATIVLAAARNVYGVALGAIFGHACCTLMAVLVGRILSTVLSIKTGKIINNLVNAYLVTMFGGILFIIFAILALI